VYLHRSLLQSVFPVNQYIDTVLSFTLCYMYISVSTPYYSLLCVTCKDVYIHRSLLHSVLHVGQCIYTLLFFTLCYQ